MRAMGPVSGQAVTLANSIIGVGILAMPFCFKQCGIILSILILILSGFMSRLACHFLLKSATMSRRRNFEVLAYHVFGSTGKLAVEIGIIGFLMGTCVAYFVVVGDLGPQIIAKMFNLNHSDSLRTGVMVIVSVVCVLPLGLLRNVDSLSNVCAATIGFYFCLVVKIIGEASNQLFSYDWISKVEFWQPAGVLQCLPIFAMALFCQTQLFEIYDTLPTASMDKMNTVTKNAIHICSVVYVLVGMFGYIAFCNQPISGNILVSFSPTMGSDAIKMGFVMSLAFSFPLIIFPCRASLYSLLYKKGQGSPHEILSNLIPETRFRCLTFGIVAISLLIGLMLPNIELVLGLVGSTIGVMICVIFPATCFICVSSKYTNERVLAQIVLCFGIVIMVLGTYANLQAAEIDRVGLESKLVTGPLHVKHILESKVMKALSPAPAIDILKLEHSIIHESNKPILEELPSREENVLKLPDDVKDENKNLKESKFQPPNPVPPVNNGQMRKNSAAKIKEAQISEAKDKVQIETDIKNQNAIDNDNANKDDREREGGGDSEVRVEKVDKKSSTETDALHRSQNAKTKVEAEDAKAVEDAVKIVLEEERNNDKKIEDFKNEELMEKLKHHEEEQRKMIKEQAEILHEIKKTQQEIKKENIVKMGEDIGKSSLENKKLALKSIQKLAKLAIESLGVDINLLTDSPPRNSPKETPQNNLDNNVDVAPLLLTVENKEKLPVNFPAKYDRNENIISNDIPNNPHIKSNSVHVHKQDEPESYKIGEDTKIVAENKTNIEYGPKIHQSNIDNNVPIAIALSKKKANDFIHKNDTPNIPLPSPVKTLSNNEGFKNTSVDKSQPLSNDHFGVDRDILEVKTDNPQIENEFIPKQRRRRAASDCLDKKMSVKRISRMYPVDENDQNSFK